MMALTSPHHEQWLTVGLTHLGDGLHGADVGVRTEENVLKLGFLLVNPLHGQLAAPLLGHFHLASVTPAICSLLRTEKCFL